MTEESFQWIVEPFQHFLRHQGRVARLVFLADRAISMHPDLLLEILAQDQAHSERAYEGIVAAMQREVQDGFPLLYGQATVSLWGALECLIRDFLVNWLVNVPIAMQADAVRKIKISLADYERLTDEDRYYYIVEMLERGIGASLKRGVSRFEGVLGIFDLSGPVDEEVKKTLFELCNVRNALVHRRGIADKRLVDACPWLGLEVGDPVVVTYDVFTRYFVAVSDYASAIVNRVKDYPESHGGLGRLGL